MTSIFTPSPSVRDFDQLPIVHSTKVKVQVDSHNHGRLSIDGAVKGFQYEKSIIDSGSLVLSLAPYREWRDLLAANDLVNVYIKLGVPNDPVIYNVGWVRLFFGYINDVRADESVDSEGKFTISFSVTCSDFQKVVEKTEIYNNPYLRSDETYGANLVGSYLMRMGVTDQGNPRVLVMNHLAALLGFGKQWLLPVHYDDKLPSNLNVDFSFGTDVPPSLLQNVSLTEFFAPNRSRNDVFKQVQELRGLVERLVYFHAGGAANAAYIDGIAAANIISANVAALSSLGEAEIVAPDPLGDRLEALLSIEQPESTPVQQTIDPTSPLSTPKTIYDVLSFDYMEYTDGYIVSIMIFESSGSLIGLLRRDSHEVLNELIFDLRPTADLYQGSVDGLGNPLDGGLAMIPCVILRERPFTYFPTTQGSANVDFQGEQIESRVIDMSDIRAVIEDRTPSDLDPALLPTLVDWGGSVWMQSQRVKNYGPSVGMNAEASFTNAAGGGDASTIGLFNRGPRTLEQIQINSSDVLSASLGRGDQDVLTGFDFIPVTELGEDQVYYQRDISPQFRHLLIRRHGMRMMFRTSEFSGPVIPGTGRFPDEKIDLGSDFSGNPVFILSRQIAASFAGYMTLRIVTITDHWYQHNLEYLNGTIVLRPMPGIRVGYRLDWVDRDLSFYVESVQHAYQYPGMMLTTIKVTRGQPLSRPLRYIKPDDRVKGEDSLSAQLGINFPIADSRYMDRETRQRVGPPPGHPGRYSPSIIHQNLNTAIAAGVHETALQVPYPSGVNRAGEVPQPLTSLSGQATSADTDDLHVDPPIIRHI